MQGWSVQVWAFVDHVDASVEGSCKVCLGLGSRGTLDMDCVNALAKGSCKCCTELRVSWQSAGGDAMEVP